MLASGLVATITVILPMTFRATKIVSFNVFFMAEDDSRRGMSFPNRVINLGFRFGNRWMHAPDEVVRCGERPGGRRQRGAGLGPMAHAAVRLSAPLAMTAHALAVVCALQSGLANIDLAAVVVMARLTSRVFQPFGSIMVTQGTTTGHVRHLGVTLMIKRDGQIMIFEFVQNYDSRSAFRGEFPLDAKSLRSRA